MASDERVNRAVVSELRRVRHLELWESPLTNRFVVPMESLPLRAPRQYISGGFFELQRIAFTSGHAGLDEARPADVPVDRISAFVMAVTVSGRKQGLRQTSPYLTIRSFSFLIIFRGNLAVE